MTAQVRNDDIAYQLDAGQTARREFRPQDDATGDDVVEHRFRQRAIDSVRGVECRDRNSLCTTYGMKSAALAIFPRIEPVRRVAHRVHSIQPAARTPGRGEWIDVGWRRWNSGPGCH